MQDRIDPDLLDTWGETLFVTSSFVVPLLKFLCVKELGRNGVAVKDATFESVDCLRTISHKHWSSEKRLTLKAESWLVNLTKTMAGDASCR